MIADRTKADADPGGTTSSRRPSLPEGCLPLDGLEAGFLALAALFGALHQLRTHQLEHGLLGAVAPGADRGG